MAIFPVLLEHHRAVGEVNGKEVRASTLQASAAILVARGADQLVVPAPTAFERELVEEGIAGLPKERHGMVRMVDGNGEVLERVQAYLAPLAVQATKWPESAFVSFSETFLYQLALASRERSGIVADSVDVVRGFVPIIDPRVFIGEARFRLAELVNLICAYEPSSPEHLSFIGEKPHGSAPNLWRILDLSEFHTLIAESGALGLAQNPKVALRRLRLYLVELIRKPEASQLLKLVPTAVDVAGAEQAAGPVEKFGQFVMDRVSGADFRPAFLGLGPAQMGVYQETLRSIHPLAKPHPGSCMALESIRGVKQGMIWLNEGDEDKLEREAAAGIESRLRRLEEARRVQLALLG